MKRIIFLLILFLPNICFSSDERILGLLLDDLAPAGCGGTLDFNNGDIETFEYMEGDFCTSQFYILDNTNGAILTTYSTAGNYLDGPCYIFDDTTAGNHAGEVVQVPIPDNDNDNSYMFEFEILHGPDAWNSISVMTWHANSAPSSGQVARMLLVGDNGQNELGPFNVSIIGSENTSSMATLVNTHYYATVHINPYTAGSGSSTFHRCETKYYGLSGASDCVTETFRVQETNVIDFWSGGSALNSSNRAHMKMDNMRYTSDNNGVF